MKNQTELLKELNGKFKSDLQAMATHYKKDFEQLRQEIFGSKATFISEGFIKFGEKN